MCPLPHNPAPGAVPPQGRQARGAFPAEAFHRDIRLDIALAPEIAPAGPVDATAEPRIVLVTGGTGFLGAFVIADLLRLTGATVYCLVRAASSAEAAERLSANLAHYGLAPADAATRIVAVAGDLEAPGWNLDPRTYAWLAEHVEVIYHLAASVSFMPAYGQMKAINVTALTEVLRLACLKRTKAVHYTSTYAVFNSDAYLLAKTVHETELTGTDDGFIRGYDRSKWVAEHICRIAKARGIPVTIYRAGFISGDTATGIHNRMDPIAQLFAVMLCAGYTFPLRAYLHLTPVDFCSRALVTLSMRPGATNGIFHLVQESPLAFMEIVDWLRREGRRLAYVEFAEWYEHLKLVCRTYPAFMPMLYFFSRGAAPYGEGENIASLRFDATNVRHHLSPDDHCPTLDDALLRKYFAYIASPDRGYEVARPLGAGGAA